MNEPWLRWMTEHRLAANVSTGPLELDWALCSELAGNIERLEDMLRYQTTFQKGVDRKTQAAYFIIEYANALSVPLVAALSKTGEALDITEGAIAWRTAARNIEHEGEVKVEKIIQFRLLSLTAADCKVPAPGTASSQIDELRDRLERHFGPLINRLVQMTGLSSGAQWRLVTDAFAATFLDIGTRTGRVNDAVALAESVLKHPGSPLANDQMHFFQLDIPLGEGKGSLSKTYRARGGCCRYYKTEGGHLCTTCVLEKPEERDRRLTRGLLARLARMQTSNPTSKDGILP